MRVARIVRIATAMAAIFEVATSGAVAQAACGDGSIQLLVESCDDGNLVLGDGCNTNCQIEAGYGCSGVPSSCYFFAAAGFDSLLSPPDGDSAIGSRDVDGAPDYQALDQDHDGLRDNLDPAPDDPCIPSPNSLACPTGDSDHDGAPNQSDSEPDDPCLPDANGLACASGDRDGDGLDNAFECPGLRDCRDTDGDGLPDYDDPDSDNDGVPDARECVDENSCGAADSDGDGVPDLLDPDLPQLSGGACSASPSGGAVPSLGWLLAILILGLLGRHWRRIPLRRRAHKQARARNS